MAITRPRKRGGTATEEPAASAAAVEQPEARRGRETRSVDVRTRVRDSWPVLLLRAAHPKQALVTAGAMALAASLSGRPGREVAVVAATLLVGQAILGWHNDLVDRVRDERHHARGKPLADGRLDPATVWFALACAALAVVPLSIATGVTAGTVYLLSLAIGMLGNVALRRGPLSFLTWAMAFALYPAYLSFGGWGGGAEGDPPQVAMTVLAALLGVGVHVLRATSGLVADNDDGWRYLPLVLGLRLGATRLLALSVVWIVLVVVGMAVVGGTLGLRQ